MNTWMPKKRNVTYIEKPDWIPDWVYTNAVVAKRQYNEQWEYWVFLTSKDHNCSQALAEDACIRGIKKELDRLDFVYGPKIAQWFRQFLDMDSIISMVKHPTYTEVKLEGV
jgi:hypothetical protein